MKAHFLQWAQSAHRRAARCHEHLVLAMVSLSATVMCTPAAAADTAGASSTKADFSMLTNFLQEFVNFMTGPFGKGAVVISIIAAFCTWVFAPKDGIFAPVLRVTVAGIAIMNAAVWITHFGSATSLTLTP